MPVRKHKKYSSRKKSNPFNRIFIVFLLVIVLGGAGYKISESLLSGTGVLGASTLLARGGPGGQGQNGIDRTAEGGKEKLQKIDPNFNPGEGLDHMGPPQFNNVERAGQPGTEGSNFLPDPRKGKPQGFQHGNDDNNEGQDHGPFANIGDVRIATDGGGFDIPGKHLGAMSHFPISINPNTHELIITTPAGTKTVAILPDRAIQNLMLKGILSKIGGHIISTGSAEFGGDGATRSGFFFHSSESGDQEVAPAVEADQNVELTVQNGDPVYKVKGSKTKKLFGILPVSVNKTVTVSAESGDVESTSVPIFDRFLDIFSL